jgi:uncharacterized integral membrane protein
MSVLAAIRPSDWEFPLFVHVLGAMVLVGGLITVVGFQALAWRGRDRTDVLAFDRAAFWALLTVAIPGWIVMRLGGEWIYSEEGWSGEDDPSWLGIGYTTADLGLPLLLIATILAGLAMRRSRRGEGTSVLGRIATPLAVILLVAYLVAVWAMTAKPT